MRRAILALLAILLAASFPRKTDAQNLEGLTESELCDPSVKKDVVVRTNKGPMRFNLNTWDYFPSGQTGGIYNSFVGNIRRGNLDNMVLTNSTENCAVAHFYGNEVYTYRLVFPGSLFLGHSGDISFCPWLEEGRTIGVRTNILRILRNEQNLASPAIAISDPEDPTQKASNLAVIGRLVKGDTIREVTLTKTRTRQVSGDYSPGSGISNFQQGSVIQENNMAKNLNVGGESFGYCDLRGSILTVSLYELLMQDGRFRRDSLHESFDEQKMGRFWDSLGYRNRSASWFAVSFDVFSREFQELPPGRLVLDINGRKIPPYMPNNTISGAVMDGPRFWRVLWNYVNRGLSRPIQTGPTRRGVTVLYLIRGTGESRLGSFGNGLSLYEIGPDEGRYGKIFDQDPGSAIIVPPAADFRR